MSDQQIKAWLAARLSHDARRYSKSRCKDRAEQLARDCMGDLGLDFALWPKVREAAVALIETRDAERAAKRRAAA